MKFKIPFLSRLLEIKEEQLKIENEKIRLKVLTNKYLYKNNLLLNELLEVTKLYVERKLGVSLE